MSEPVTILDYEVERSMGSGSQGAVYRAHREGNPQEVVALKVVEQTGNLERLLLEPELLAQLHHRNIVELKDYGLHAGKLVLVMEYIDGRTLTEWIEKSAPLPAAEVRFFLRQMADALSFAHRAGVFHADLKPENILVDERSPAIRYVIVDFGVSRVVRGIQTRRRLEGTYRFMSPEQIRGRGGTASDLWAVGVIAYQMATGRLPFTATGLDNLAREVHFKEAEFEVRDLEKADWDLQQIILKLLAKSPIDRMDAAALREALSPAAEALEPAVVESGKAVPVAPWEHRMRLDVRRRWFWIAGLAALTYLPNGIVPVFFAVGGAHFVTVGSDKRRGWLIAAGLGLLLAGFVVDNLINVAMTAGQEDTGAVLLLLSIVFGFLLIPAGYHLAKIRQSNRELVLLGAARRATGSERLIVLKGYCDTNVGDLSTRLRYVEMLLSAGRAKEAAVEALTILRVDQYNFDATLLLAHAYLELGLVDRCRQVCDGYLEVSGQCFEFVDLRQRATALIAGDAA